VLALTKEVKDKNLLIGKLRHEGELNILRKAFSSRLISSFFVLQLLS